MKRIFLILLILFSMNVLACDECSAFENDPSSDSFALIPEDQRTSEMLLKLDKPVLDDFKLLNQDNQKKYLTSNFNQDFAQDYLSNVDISKNLDIADNFFMVSGSLSKIPIKANDYLKKKTNSNIDFEVVQGMDFSDNPLSLSTNGKVLNLAIGSTIPQGTSKVYFENDEYKFISSEREINLKFDSAKLNEDGSITLNSVAFVKDSGSGEVITLNSGSKVSFKEGTLIVNGKSTGTFSKGSYVNIEGELELGNTISSTNSQLTLANSKVSGKFRLELANDKIKTVHLLAKDSKYIDNFGKVRGVAKIDIGVNGWESIDSLKSEVEYNGKLLSGQFKAKISESLDSVRGNFKYLDKEKDISIVSKNLFFGSIPENIPQDTVYVDGENLAGKGKVSIKTEVLSYEGLQNSASFKYKDDGKASIDISSEEEGKVAILKKRLKIGDFDLTVDSFSQEYDLNSVVYNKEGKLSLRIDEKNLRKLASVEQNPDQFILINKDLQVNLGDDFLLIGDDVGIAYQTSTGRVDIMSPRTVHQFLGNDLDTSKKIVKDEISFNSDVSLHNNRFTKILDLQRNALVKDNSITLKDSIKAFDEIKTFVTESFENKIQSDAALNTFILSNVRDVNVETTFDGSFDERLKSKSDFVSKNLQEVRTNINSQEFIKYSSLNDFVEILAEDNVKSSLTQQFENVLILEQMSKQHDADYKVNSINLQRAYKGLISLEETSIVDGGASRDSSKLTSKKLAYANMLANELQKDGDTASALAVVQKIKNDFSRYIGDKDLDNPETKLHLTQLGNALQNMELRIDSSAFNTLKLDLLSQQGELGKLFARRQTGSEKISESLSKDGSLTIFGKVMFSGGYGKDVLTKIGVYESIPRDLAHLNKNNKNNLQGLSALQILRETNVPPATIRAWVNDELTEADLNTLAGEILVSDGKFSNRPNEGTTSPFESSYSGQGNVIQGNKVHVDRVQMATVFGFLKVSKDQAKKFYDSEYNVDVKKLIGLNKVNGLEGEYTAFGKLSIDGSKIKTKFKEQLKQYEFSDVEEIINFVDEGVSPAAVVLGGGFGAAQGTIFSSATGTAGFGLGVVENVVFDMAAASTIQAYGGDMNDPLTAMATMVGVGGALGSVKYISNIQIRKVARDIASIPAKSFSKSNLEDVLKSENIDLPQEKISDLFRDVEAKLKASEDVNLEEIVSKHVSPKTNDAVILGSDAPSSLGAVSQRDILAQQRTNLATYKQLVEGYPVPPTVKVNENQVYQPTASGRKVVSIEDSVKIKKRIQAGENLEDILNDGTIKSRPFTEDDFFDMIETNPRKQPTIDDMLKGVDESKKWNPTKEDVEVVNYKVRTIKNKIAESMGLNPDHVFSIGSTSRGTYLPGADPDIDINVILHKKMVDKITDETKKKKYETFLSYVDELKGNTVEKYKTPGKSANDALKLQRAEHKRIMEKMGRHMPELNVVPGDPAHNQLFFEIEGQRGELSFLTDLNKVDGIINDKVTVLKTNEMEAARKLKLYMKNAGLYKDGGLKGISVEQAVAQTRIYKDDGTFISGSYEKALARLKKFTQPLEKTKKPSSIDVGRGRSMDEVFFDESKRGILWGAISSKKDYLRNTYERSDFDNYARSRMWGLPEAMPHSTTKEKWAAYEQQTRFKESGTIFAEFDASVDDLSLRIKPSVAVKNINTWINEQKTIKAIKQNPAIKDVLVVEDFVAFHKDGKTSLGIRFKDRLPKPTEPIYRNSGRLGTKGEINFLETHKNQQDFLVRDEKGAIHTVNRADIEQLKQSGKEYNFVKEIKNEYEDKIGSAIILDAIKAGKIKGVKFKPIDDSS